MHNPRIVVAALLLVTVVSAAGRTFAQDWPQWRGPGCDGKATGFTAPQTWPKALIQKWKTPIGLGDTTPALVGEKLYAFGRQEADEVVTCIDAATGKTVWQESYPAQFVVTGPSARHPGPRSSPAVADGKVCTLGVGGILSCLDAATGKVVWRKQSAADYLDIQARFESSTSPLVVDGLCIVYVGGKGKGAMIAFDLAGGQAKWKCEGEGPAASSPALMTADGVRQVVTLSEKQLMGVALADGKLLWQTPFQANRGNNTTPVIDGPVVFITGENKGTRSMKIEKQGGQFAARELWANSDTRFSARFTTPILRDGLLFGNANGKFFCLNARTGAVNWLDTENRGNSAAIVDAGPVLFATATNGELAACQPDGKQYTELLRFKVSETETWAHPVIAGKRIFVRDRDAVTMWGME
ncbi:MAG: PQQ-binding-like beta-propeller repeat protein [Tepidisphaerales bacterium]